MSIDSEIMRLLSEFEAAVRLAATTARRYRDGEIDTTMENVVDTDKRVSTLRERFRVRYAPRTAGG